MVGQADVKLCEMAETFWKKHSKRYRTLIPEYHELIKKKRELKITPLNQVKRSTLNEIPEIDFLKISNKKELRSRLKKYSAEKLSAELIAASMMVESYAYRTIEAHIFDYQYEIRHYGDKKGGIGTMDPSYCQCGAINSRRTHAEAN
ncbi:hypothetical protein IKF57_00760 [Candidatus Saccharibacteria bacterium]|nr:hypothetical protein [Candidatus Saccharibacteria bacterium]